MLLKKIKNSIVKEKFSPVVLFSLFIVLAYYNLLLLENSRPGNLLLEAIEYMEANYNKLEINIQEKGPGYSLNFKGKKFGQEYLGNFLDYNLQVYKNSTGSIYVKDLKDGVWKEAKELGLEKIQYFFISPFELLSSYSSSFHKSKFIHVPGEEEVVISLDTPALPNTIKGFYSDGIIPESLNIGFLITIGENEPFIRELSISLYDKDNLKKALLRTFSFKG